MPGPKIKYRVVKNKPKENKEKPEKKEEK